MGELRFDGRRVPLRPGDTIGAALHRDGVRVLGRSMKYHRPRGLACGVGSCGSCLVEVDGEPNVTACTRQAADGMAVRSQNRLGSARHDLLGVVDKVYPGGFDPHGAFTRPRILNEAFLKAVRMMSGLGRVPSVEQGGLSARRHVHRVAHLVVGAGRHGLAAAQASADAGEEVLLVDEAPRLGGSAQWDPEESGTRSMAHAIQQSTAQTWTRTVCFGLYDGVAGLMRPGAAGMDLWEVAYDRITLAAGRHEEVPLFPENDLPGVMTYRAACRLLHGHQVLPGRLVAVHGVVPSSFVAAVQAAGGQIVASGEVSEVRGGVQVERARVDGVWQTCDVVVCVVPGTPRLELLQQAGCRLTVQHDVLVPEVDDDGQTSVPGVRAAFTLHPRLEEVMP